MNFIKTTSISFIMLFFMASFSNCSSTKTTNLDTTKLVAEDLQDKPSFKLGETYYKHWVAGVKGGGSGITMLISIAKNKNNVVLDSVYFKGMKAKLEPIKSGYAANFKTKANQKEDIIMSTEKNAEFGNQLPNKANYSFQLKDNECVISYIENATTKYFKIENLVEKPRDQYPSAPPKQ